MVDEPTDAKAGMPGKGQPAGKDQVREARAALPGQVRESGFFDLDYDPSDLARLNEIFDYLPDRTVLDVAKRLKTLIAEKQPDFSAFSAEYGISPAERKLLESLVSGLTVVAHAENAGVSVNTARTHMRRLLEKTGSSGQLDLIRKAHGGS